MDLTFTERELHQASQSADHGQSQASHTRFRAHDHARLLFILQLRSNITDYKSFLWEKKNIVMWTPCCFLLNIQSQIKKVKSYHV